MKVKSAKNKISPEGDLIFENAEKGKEVFLSALDKIDSSKAVIIDLSKVDEIDSSGFQLLLAFIRTLQNRDIEFNIRKIRAEGNSMRWRKSIMIRACAILSETSGICNAWKRR